MFIITRTLNIAIGITSLLPEDDYETCRKVSQSLLLVRIANLDPNPGPAKADHSTPQPCYAIPLPLGLSLRGGSKVHGLVNRFPPHTFSNSGNHSVKDCAQSRRPAGVRYE